ncbi:MAG: hypothetical protein MJ196_08090 [Treponemataceae bacterium]|nr:hypothetical protein [Treponemataceae bacterium]
MKKNIFTRIAFCGIFSIINTFVFAQNAAVPMQARQDESLAPLAGIWENKSRFVIVDSDNNLNFVLKTFYGYYYDQAASLPASLEYRDTGETILRVKYAGNKKRLAHPLSVMNDKLFLDFYCRGSAFLQAGEQNDESIQVYARNVDQNTARLLGFWRCCGNVVSGIEVAEPQYKNELRCYYFTDKNVYFLRYWQADVDYEPVLAIADDDTTIFEVDKFLKVGDIVYTCVVGRGINIRNIEKHSYSYDGEKLIFDGKTENPLPVYLSGDGSLLSLKEPYLTKSTIGDMQSVIAEHNSLRHNPLKNPMEVFNRKTSWELLLEKM